MTNATKIQFPTMNPTTHTPMTRALAESMKEQTDRWLDATVRLSLSDTEYEAVVVKSTAAKAALWEAFTRHPCYNGKGQIVLPDKWLGRTINISRIREIEDFFKAHITYTNCVCAEFRLWSAALAIFNEGLDGNSVFTEDAANVVNERLSKWADMTGRELRRGQLAAPSKKLSKVLTFIGELAGFEEIVDIRDVSFTDQHGVFHAREKDFGWKGVKAWIGDAFNPIDETATLVFSVNPADFLTMSIGAGWGSCMSIDKENRRNIRNQYSGMYCGGTMSYALDGCSVVVYYLPDGFKGNPEENEKIKRAIISVGRDFFIMSRLYPDGRDGGCAGLAKYVKEEAISLFREIGLLRQDSEIASEQRHIWEDGDWYWKGGIQYNDLEHCDDCFLVYDKEAVNAARESRIFKPIVIGKDPICPCCGQIHDNEDSPFCDTCHSGRFGVCAHCGCDIHNEEDAVYDVNGDMSCRDCVAYCECCNEYVPVDDVTEVRVGRRTWQTAMICHDCLYDSGEYVALADSGDWVSVDLTTETEEGDFFLDDDEGEPWSFRTCERCGHPHTAEGFYLYADGGECHIHNHNGEWLCDDCLTAETEEKTETEE